MSDFIPLAKFNPEAPSEGMRYGPVPPPELDEQTTSAEWIMDMAEGDETVYQYLMLIESLEEDKYTNPNYPSIDTEVYKQNKDRLERATRAHIAAKVIDKLVEEKPALGLIRQKRRSSV